MKVQALMHASAHTYVYMQTHTYMQANEHSIIHKTYIHTNTHEHTCTIVHVHVHALLSSYLKAGLYRCSNEIINDNIQV